MSSPPSRDRDRGRRRPGRDRGDRRRPHSRRRRGHPRRRGWLRRSRQDRRPDERDRFRQPVRRGRPARREVRAAECCFIPDAFNSETDDTPHHDHSRRPLAGCAWLSTRTRSPLRALRHVLRRTWQVRTRSTFPSTTPVHTRRVQSRRSRRDTRPGRCARGHRAGRRSGGSPRGSGRGLPPAPARCNSHQRIRRQPGVILASPEGWAAVTSIWLTAAGAWLERLAFDVGSHQPS
jgi:hypothetical protein